MRDKLKRSLLTLAIGAGLIVGAAGGADAIVNGNESATGARPYQVSLQSGGEHYCGGTVIDATTIVTAAHCVEDESASGTTIRAGVTDVTSSAGQDVAVASITSHPSYAQNELADIAVIKLAEPLQLGGNVQAIALATAEQVAAASTGTVSGWGAVSEEGDGSATLLEAQVPLVSDAACSTALGADAATEVCAGGTGTDSCYGDSGGPLVVDSANGPVLAGVVSWGEECGGATPGVYADVPGLANWVNENRDGAAADGENTDPDETTDQQATEDDNVINDDENIDDDFGDDELGDRFDDEDYLDDEFGDMFDDEDGYGYDDENYLEDEFGDWYEDEDGNVYFDDEFGDWYEDEDGNVYFEDEFGDWYEDEDGNVYFDDEFGDWYEDEDGNVYFDEDADLDW